MEVHAHPHTARKKWTHYFWEFLMLFLAVFCGFLAENIRERSVERHREKQFIASLISDLKLDTAGFARSITFKKGRQLDIDSVLYPLTKMRENKLQLGQCIILLQTVGNPYFFSNNGTIQQLKGSGGMRLISNRKVVDSIESYDFQIRRIMLRQEEINSFSQHELGRIIDKFIPSKDYFEERYDSVYQEKTYDPQKIMKVNSIYINELINRLMDIKEQNNFEIWLYTDTKDKAENIIHFLKQEYHLE